MKELITRGDTSVIRQIFLQDSTVTDGAGKTGLAFGAFACRYIRPGLTLSGAITPQDISVLGTYATPTANTNIRIKEVDAVNWAGLYEIQLHDDWISGAGDMLSIKLSATDMAQANIEFQIVDLDLRIALSAATISAVSGAVGSVIGAVGSVAGNVDGSVANVLALADGILTTAKIGAAAFTADKFAVDFLTASGLKADAITKIVTGLFATTGVTVGGTMTYQKLMRLIASFTFGNFDRVDGPSDIVVTFKDPDNNSTIAVMTIPNDGSGRTVVIA